MRKLNLIFVFGLFLLTASCGSAQADKAKYPDPKEADSKTVYPVKYTDAEWKARLTDLQYNSPSPRRYGAGFLWEV